MSQSYTFRFSLLSHMLIILRKTERKLNKWLIQWLAEYKKTSNREQQSKTKLICPIPASPENQISQSQLKENIAAGVKRAKASAITPWKDKRCAIIHPIKSDKSKPQKTWKSLATLTRKSHLRTKFGTNSWI